MMDDATDQSYRPDALMSVEGKIPTSEQKHPVAQKMLRFTSLQFILNYLNLEEAFTVASTCRAAKEVLDKFNRFWTERCIRSFTSPLLPFQLVDTVTRDDPNNLRNTEQMLAFSTSFPDTSGNLAIQGETMESKFWEQEAQSPEELLESLGFEEQPLLFNQNSSSELSMKTEIPTSFLSALEIERMVSKMHPLQSKECRDLLELQSRVNIEWITIAVHSSTLGGAALFETHEAVQIRNLISQTFKSPPLPQPSLTRQNQLVTTSSLFQDSLAEFVFDEQDRYDSLPKLTKKSTITIAEKFLQPEAIQVLKADIINDKGELAALLKMRWYQTITPQEKKNMQLRNSIFGPRSTLLISKETRASTTSALEMPFEESQATVEANQLFSSIGSLDGSKNQNLWSGQGQAGMQMFESVQVRDSWLSESESMGASSSSTLLKIVQNIHQQAVVYCRFVKLMVERQQRQSDIIQEYTKYWDAYSAGAVHIHEELFGVAAVLNEIYEHAYPSMPCFPKFSFLRLLVSVWRREVFSLLKEKLLTHAFDYIARHRKKIRKYGAMLKTKRKSVSSTDMASPQVQGFLRSNESQGQVNNNLRFKKSNLLRRFVASLIDISVQELSVHYLQHIKLNLSQTAYHEFEERLIQESKEFQQKSAEAFPMEIMVEMIHHDQRWLSEVVSVQTRYKISLKAMKVVDGGFTMKLKKKYQEFRKDGKKDPNFSQPLLWSLKSKEAQALRETVGHKDEAVLFKFISHLHRAGQAALIQRIVKYKSQTQMLQEELEYTSKKLQKKNEKHKGIELELSKQEQHLYSLSKDIELDYVEQIAQEHNQALMELAEADYNQEVEEEEEELQLPSPLPLLNRIPESAKPNFPDRVNEFVPPPPMPGMDYSQILGLPSLPSLPTLIKPQKKKKEKKQVEENYLAGFDEKFLAAMPESLDVNFSPQLALEKPKSRYPFPTEFSVSEIMVQKSSLAENSPNEDEDVFYL